MPEETSPAFQDVTPLRFDAVLFDATGTLIHPHCDVGTTYAEVAARFGFRCSAPSTPKRLAVAFGRSLVNAPPLCFPDAERDEIDRLERSWWLSRVSEVFAEFPAFCRSSQFGEFFATLYRFYASPQAWDVDRDAIDLLRCLKAGGLRTGVVSNFDSRLNTLLEGLGLSRLFDTLVWSSRAGAAKPDPAVFRLALRRIEVLPQRALHVGDNWLSDYKGARGAGLSAALFDPLGTATERRIVRISRLGQVVSMLRESGRFSDE